MCFEECRKSLTHTNKTVTQSKKKVVCLIADESQISNQQYTRSCTIQLFRCIGSLPCNHTSKTRPKETFVKQSKEPRRAFISHQTLQAFLILKQFTFVFDCVTVDHSNQIPFMYDSSLKKRKKRMTTIQYHTLQKTTAQ